MQKAIFLQCILHPTFKFTFCCGGQWRWWRRCTQEWTWSPWHGQRSVEGSERRPGHVETHHVQPRWRWWLGSDLHIQVGGHLFTKLCNIFHVYCIYFLSQCVLYSFCRNAIAQLCMFKQIERRPMAWPCQLTVGSCLSIRIVGYKAVGLVEVHQRNTQYTFITNLYHIVNKNVP